MRIFVTGGSGFVGQNVIPKLREAGHEVLALARSTASAAKVEAVGAGAVRDDLLDLGPATRTALARTQAVVHLAAHMDFTYDPKPFLALNVRATELLLTLAHQAGVATFVYVSAAPVVPDTPAVRLTEAAASEELPSELYPRTKAMAERLVLAADEEGFRTVALRPPAIWGPHNHHFDDLFANVAAGKWRWIGGGRQVLSTIHVYNLASAIIATLATEAGGGNAYFVTDGDRRPMRETFTRMFREIGLDGGDKELPRGLAVAMASGTEFVWKLFGMRSRPPIAPLMIRLMATEFSVSDARAREELGYRNAVDFEQGLATLR